MTRAFTQAGLHPAPGQHTWELSVTFPSPRNQTCAHLQFLYQETQFLIRGKHLHRKEAKHPEMLGRLHHTQWGTACRANPTRQPLPPYSLSAKQVGAAALAKERKKGEEGTPVRCCPKEGNYRAKQWDCQIKPLWTQSMSNGSTAS